MKQQYELFEGLRALRHKITDLELSNNRKEAIVTSIIKHHNLVVEDYNQKC